MKKETLRTLIVGFVVMFLIGLLIGVMVGRGCSLKVKTTEERTTVTDTVKYYLPTAKTEKTIGTHRYIMPVYRFLGGGFRGEPLERDHIDSICKDSAIVELPMVQRHYADSAYEAWVSGPVDPRLDSVRVLSRTEYITRREWKPPKRWHIGITAGYGYGTKGFQPYIGVGITYSIISF